MVTQRAHQRSLWAYLLIAVLFLHQTLAFDYGGCSGTVTVAPELSKYACYLFLIGGVTV